jgi:uncharacterized membrane protein YdcZ (DUF606 family)
MKHLVREAVLYSAASGVALLVDVSLLYVLVEHVHLHYLAATAIAFLSGTVVVYLISVSAIFRHRRLKDRKIEFVVFATIGAVGLLVNLGVMRIAVGGFGMHYLLGKAISIAFTFTLNFGLRRALLFSPEKAVAVRNVTGDPT